MSSQNLIFIAILLLSANFLQNILTKVVVVPDTSIEVLQEGFDGPKYIDYTDIQIIPENETHTYVNGTMKWLVDVRKWKFMIFAEQRLRGEWVFKALNRTYENYCVDMKYPMDPGYKYFGHFNCPMPAGTVWLFDMVLFELPEYVIQAMPSDYFGRWRVTFHHIFDDKEGIKREIFRVKFDVYDT